MTIQEFLSKVEVARWTNSEGVLNLIFSWCENDYWDGGICSSYGHREIRRFLGEMHGARRVQEGFGKISTAETTLTFSILPERI